MTCSPSLLKLLGIKLAMELTSHKPQAEQRLFQAIIVQALEDATNPSAFKKETYWKEDKSFQVPIYLIFILFKKTVFPVSLLLVFFHQSNLILFVCPDELLRQQSCIYRQAPSNK